MTRYIEAHKDQYGVEPICRVLEMERKLAALLEALDVDVPDALPPS
jgi:hypothetical protein